MTDRELLELAAKAAGMSPASFDGKNVGWYDPQRGTTGSWNPLADDGDAFRLMVALGIQVTPPSEQYPQAFAMEPVMQRAAHREDDIFDPFAATRRVIVRTAAFLGGLK